MEKKKKFKFNITGDLNLPRIRADCVRDVKRIQGVISLAEAVKDEENK